MGESGEAFVVALARVLEVGVAAEGAGGDAEVGEASDEFVGGGFEDEGGGVGLGVGREVVVDGGGFGGVGEGGFDQSEEGPGTDAGGGAGGQDGCEGAGEEGGFEAVGERGVVEFFVFKVGEHEVFVGFDDALDEAFARVFSGLGGVGRGGGVVLPVAGVGAPGEHGDGAAEVGFRADGEEEGLAFGAEDALC